MLLQQQGGLVQQRPVRVLGKVPVPHGSLRKEGGEDVVTEGGGGGKWRCAVLVGVAAIVMLLYPALECKYKEPGVAGLNFNPRIE